MRPRLRMTKAASSAGSPDRPSLHLREQLCVAAGSTQHLRALLLLWLTEGGYLIGIALPPGCDPMQPLSKALMISAISDLI